MCAVATAAASDYDRAVRTALVGGDFLIPLAENTLERLFSISGLTFRIFRRLAACDGTHCRNRAKESIARVDGIRIVRANSRKRPVVCVPF